MWSLSQLIGTMDWPVATMLVSAFAFLTITSTSLIIKRRSRQDVYNEFELAKVKQQNDHALARQAQEKSEERAAYALETDRSVKFKQIDQGLITSHRSDDRGDRQ